MPVWSLKPLYRSIVDIPKHFNKSVWWLSRIQLQNDVALLELPKYTASGTMALTQYSQSTWAGYSDDCRVRSTVRSWHGNGCSCWRPWLKKIVTASLLGTTAYKSWHVLVYCPAIFFLLVLYSNTTSLIGPAFINDSAVAQILTVRPALSSKGWFVKSIISVGYVSNSLHSLDFSSRTFPEQLLVRGQKYTAEGTRILSEYITANFTWPSGWNVCPHRVIVYGRNQGIPLPASDRTFRQMNWSATRNE